MTCYIRRFRVLMAVWGMLLVSVAGCDLLPETGKPESGDKGVAMGGAGGSSTMGDTAAKDASSPPDDGGAPPHDAGMDAGMDAGPDTGPPPPPPMAGTTPPPPVDPTDDATDAESQLEVCDGRDNDGDKRVDENFDVGAGCSVGLGACRREGARVCEANGFGTRCNADAAPAAVETCNGVDDDCDGLVDFSSAGGHPVSVCVCSGVDIKPQSAFRDLSEAVPQPSTCAATDDGMEMTFRLGVCSAPYPFAQCRFPSVELDRFDADHGGNGTLEIRFCIDAPMRGALNLYYGTYPGRKFLRLLSQEEQEQGLPAGCYRRFRVPTDATCPNYMGAQPGDPAHDLPDECRMGCSDARWAEKGDACLFDYDNAPLFLTAEFCVQGTSNSQVHVSELTVHYQDAKCTCATDDDCLDESKPVCDSSAVVPAPFCSKVNPRCAGVCVAR